VIQSEHLSGSALNEDTVDRWGSLASDVSAKGQSALSDLWLWLYRGFFVPGDHVLSMLSTHAPHIAQLLGLSAIGPGSVLSGLIASVVWLGTIAFLILAWRLLRDLDRALTAYIGRLYEGFLRAGRIVARRLAIAFRSHQLKRQARLARIELSEQGELTALELAVLQSHARLAPGHLSTASGIASAVGVRPSHVEQALTRLKTLSLVHRTFGAGDGEEGYRLTRAGEVFLAACSRAHAATRQEGRENIASWRGRRMNH
jgi:DNA-binding MarR family transcriptional regulator